MIMRLIESYLQRPRIIAWALLCCLVVFSLFFFQESLAYLFFFLGFAYFLKFFLFQPYTDESCSISIKMDPHVCEIDQAVFDYYISMFWKTFLPGEQIGFETLLQRKNIEIRAMLPSMSFQQQEFLVNRVKQELQEWVEKYFGKQEPLILTISFQKKA